MKTILITLLIFLLVGATLAQSKDIKFIRFDGTDPVAEDVANFLIDSKFAVQVEYNEKTETVRFNYTGQDWSPSYGKGYWFIIKGTTLKIMSDEDFLKEHEVIFFRERKKTSAFISGIL